MSVTFSSHTPVMGQAQFGNQKPHAKTNVTQFSGTPHNPANATGPKTATRSQFGAICTTLCCAGGSVIAIPLAIVGSVIGLIVWGIRKAIK